MIPSNNVLKILFFRSAVPPDILELFEITIYNQEVESIGEKQNEPEVQGPAV